MAKTRFFGPRSCTWYTLEMSKGDVTSPGAYSAVTSIANVLKDDEVLQRAILEGHVVEAHALLSRALQERRFFGLEERLASRAVRKSQSTVHIRKVRGKTDNGNELFNQRGANKRRSRACAAVAIKEGKVVGRIEKAQTAYHAHRDCPPESSEKGRRTQSPWRRSEVGLGVAEKVSRSPAMVAHRSREEFSGFLSSLSPRTCHAQAVGGAAKDEGWREGACESQAHPAKESDGHSRPNAVQHPPTLSYVKSLAQSQRRAGAERWLPLLDGKVQYDRP